MVRSPLHIALVQFDIQWEDPLANRLQIENQFADLAEVPDLLILPEMFTTGFSMNAKLMAEPHEGDTLSWMREMALDHSSAVTGSVMVKEKGRFYNRLYFVLADGSYHWYDKKHTFTLAGEHRTYTSGSEKLIVSFKGWKICPLICYDLRFPVWARNTEDYDLLIYVANWPKKRIAAWDALLKARAIENMSYCVGVNRVGSDGNGYEYVGHSAVYDVLGDELTGSPGGSEFVQVITLEKSHIRETRKKLQFLNDRDTFNLT